MHLSPLCFAFRGGELLVRDAGAALELPDAALLERAGLIITAEERFRGPDALPCRAVELPAETDAPPGFTYCTLRRLYGRIPEALYALAGRAAQLLEWNRGHRFCGRCGEPTRGHAREQAKECPRCGALHFPRLSPAVIVSVRRHDRLLLARSPHFAPTVYSVLAGFVEPGESLEGAVAREVMEEVGVAIDNVRYFGSQPWPFPHSLMIAFTAEYAGGEIQADPDEIEDAGWYGVDAMPTVSAPLSIARHLIDHFVVEQGGDPRALRSLG
jgi:NAD+ diphosphatase